MTTAETGSWLTIMSTIATLAAVAFSLTAFSFFSAVSKQKQKTNHLSSRIHELESSLQASQEQTSSERRGRINAQQALRKALAEQRSSDGSESTNGSSSYCYPMAPIGIVQSCFSTRNGTPRQPLLVPLSRACLRFDSSLVPPEALEGLAGYSHCWILYVFHLNTNLDKLWKQPYRSKFKAKVKVPRLKGGKMGVMATRSPHRPCPIGLTVAKVEALDGHAILFSGVDLVDGTPVLDIKPYLPFSDSVQGATIPEWVKAENALAVDSVSFSMDFPASLSSCWAVAEKQSLYASADEFQSLIKEVLSWDIRSLSQQSRPHQTGLEKERNGADELLESENSGDDDSFEVYNAKLPSASPRDVTYHLILEGLDISYKIDDNFKIIVKKASLLSDAKNLNRNTYSYSMWRDKLGQHK